ncbi:hypothetical protein D3C78_1089920 [compost metagenome]
MLHARRIGCEARILRPVRLVNGGAKARELAVVAYRQQHVAVLGDEVLVGRQAGVHIARAARCPAAGHEARSLVGQHGHAHVQQCHVDVLALARAVAGIQRRQHGVAGVHAGEYIDHGHTGSQRAAAGFTVGMAGDAHQAAHGLDHEVVARALGIGAVLAEAGDGAVDQARIEGLEAVVVEAVLPQPADLEVLHHHVGFQGHAAQQGLAFGVGHVDGDGALVAVAGREVSGFARVLAGIVLAEGRAPVAGVVAGDGALDLDDVGAQVGQHLGAPGTGEHARQVQHLDAGQGRGLGNGGGVVVHGGWP